jgi:2-C-methyl-D-erythritol 4-phosphate cytidylyltransferase / 2-C-methyl-D-erythritol 2,4-cyclodiphosphate synthase
MAACVHVLLVAAGRGSRAGLGLPKQYREIGGERLLTRTLRAVLADPDVTTVTTVIHPDDEDLFRASVEPLTLVEQARIGPPAHGGETRQQSVHAGLEFLARTGEVRPDIVLIHDGARPFSSPALIARAIDNARQHGAAIPGFLVTDTIKQVSADGIVIGTPDRKTLRAVQTPQAFSFDLILEAHRHAHRAARADLTDDAAVAEHAGHHVFIFEGEPENTKITTSDDIRRADAHLLGSLLDVRMGQGYDVHAFAEGDHIWLGGIKIPHDRSLAGHSDADVLLHAITDAVLGAISDGDIGAHFPPSQAQWKGAASDIFLKDAISRVTARGGAVAHIDGTVVCERPKIGPHRDAIRARIADITGLPIGRIAVKATTSERLGFTGREEGIAALAVATVRLPFDS